MKLYLPIFLLFLTSSVYSQEEKVHYSLDAEFVYGEAELDSFITDNFVRPDYCVEKGIDFNIWVQFTVDSLSRISFVKVTDIQTTHNKWSDSFKEYIQKNLKPQLKAEAIRVIKATAGFWIPKEVEGKSTWQIVDCKIEIRTPEYSAERASMKRAGYANVIRSGWNTYIPLDTPSDNPTKYYNLGVKKMAQKKHYIAIKYFKQSLSIGNKTKDVYYNLGVSQYLYGLNKDACKSWGKAVELGDTDAQGLIEKNCK